ncbi:hypothetical protein K523DRAFT_368314 [Schizophyllum commune Tattone D]|nr:hypothetical protein K523DRAFT_368314 [Schizophyllum commune Tattone D]
MKYSMRYAGELWKKLRLNFARLPYSEMHVRLTNDRGRSCPSLDQPTVRCDQWRPSAPLPRLIHAKITLGSAHSDWGREVELAPNVYGRPSIFQNAPCLKSITLDRKGRPDLARESLPFALPWQQLQFVKLFQFPLQPCLEVLAQCQLLRSLDWWDEEDDEEDGGSHADDYVPSHRVVNSSLTELLLVVFGFGTSSVQRLLDWTTTPCLTKLETWAIPLPSLLPFLERSEYRLTSLSLTVSVFWASASEIRTLLGALQDLESLTFEYCTKTDESWEPHSEAETMDDILESLGAVLFDFGPLESYMERIPLPRLAEFHFLCKERCNIRCVHVFLHRCSVIQSKRTKELWVETQLKPADVADLRESADRNRVEIYGLDKCTAMYEALPAWDWEPPVVPSSRRDDPDIL